MIYENKVKILRDKPLLILAVITLAMAIAWLFYAFLGHEFIRAAHEGALSAPFNRIIENHNIYILEYDFKILDSALVKVSIFIYFLIGLALSIKLFYRYKIGRFLIVLSTYLISAFLILHVFMQTWGFRGDEERLGFKQMMTHTAHKPFAFRVLVPMLVNSSSSLFPSDFIDSHKEWLTETSPLIKYVQMKDFSDARVSLKYHLTYLYVSLSLVILLFSTRYLIKLIYNLPSIVSDIAPAIGILFLPLTFLHGGYFYDFFELMFLALCLICIVRRKWVFYYTLFFLAILNKEPNILLILFFMAFCQGVLPKKELMKHLAMQLFIGVITVQLLWHIFAGNPGMTIEHHLTGSIHFWLRPTSYFLFFDPYHLGFPIFPRGGNILSILFVGFLVFYKWGQKPLSLRWLFVYTSIVNISLLLYACHIDELRNLSFMFPSVYLLGVYSIYSLIYKTRLNKVPRHES